MSARFRQTFAALGGHVRPTDRSRERAIDHEGTCFAVLALMLAAAAPTPTLAQAPTPPSADDLANPIKMGMMLEDDWTTAIGRLTIKQADQSVFDVYLGHLYREGAAEPAYIFEDLAPDASGTLVGTWRRNGSTQKHSARLLLSRYDINQFAAGLEAWPEQAELSGRRGYTAPASTPPPPVTQPAPPAPPAVTRPAPPVPNTPPVETPPGPALPAAFKPLNRIDVRVDRVIVARGYPTYQVHAFVTVKSTSASPLYLTSGFMKAVLADADGASWERSQPYRASGEPAGLFGSTPVIQPGGELKVRYVFLPEADARLTSLTFSEGGQRAEFPVMGF